MHYPCAFLSVQIQIKYINSFKTKKSISDDDICRQLHAISETAESAMQYSYLEDSEHVTEGAVPDTVVYIWLILSQYLRLNVNISLLTKFIIIH